MLQKIIRRQQPYVYVNAKVKVHDLLGVIKNKMDRQRVLVCIQSLMKKGQIEKSIKIMREVIYNLFQEESERRSVLGGIYYIIDGIRRLEHAMELMPIKKKGRVRYKKAKAIHAQKSIGRAVQLLIKFAQQKVFETQQSYVTVLTQEFKELYKGISKLYKKNDELYQEIITLRFRKKYHIKPAIYLAKFRKTQDNYKKDRQTQKKIILRRGKKMLKRFRRLKKLKYKIRINKLIKKIKKKFRKEVMSVFTNTTSTVVLNSTVITKQESNISKKGLWYALMRRKLRLGHNALILYNLATQLYVKKKAVQILFDLNVRWTAQHIGINWVLKKMLSLLKKTKYYKINELKVIDLKQEEIAELEQYKDAKIVLQAWLQNREPKQVKKCYVPRLFYALKKINTSFLNYIYILKFKQYQQVTKKLKRLQRIKSLRPLLKFKTKVATHKKRITIYKHKKRGKKYPNDRLYTKPFLAQFMITNNQKKKYGKKEESQWTAEQVVNLKLARKRALSLNV